jgi:hypothetical protein
MRRLVLLLILASPLAAQTVTNGSFEANPPAGNYNYACPQMWTCNGQYWGMQNPTLSQLPVIPDGKTVLWMQNATAAQDLGPADPKVNYTLTYFVGSQASFPIPKVYGASLGAISCTQTGAIPLIAGAMVQQTMTCTGTGELVLTLLAGPSQVMFDNVVLTATPIAPPVFDTLTFGIQLVNCSKCDGSDNIQLVAGNIFSGATLKLTQDGQNVCSAIFSSSQATCTGPVNVTPAMVNLLPIVTNPSGAQLNTGQVAEIPALLVNGAVTGNVTLILGFDSSTMVPRSFQVYSH